MSASALHERDMWKSRAEAAEATITSLTADNELLQRHHTSVTEEYKRRWKAAEAARDAFQRELDEAIEEHGQASGFWGRAAARATTRAKQNAKERDALLDALRQYGQHKPECPKVTGYNPQRVIMTSKKRAPCTCGLSTLLGGLTPKP